MGWQTVLAEQNRKIFVRRKLRKVINTQMMFGQTDISSIVFDPKSRDDIPQLLRGLQHLYTDPQLRERVFSVLAEILPVRSGGAGKASRKTGRPGMVEDLGSGRTPVGV